MTNQGQAMLFGESEPTPPPPKRKRKLDMVCKADAPFGKSDKSGKYWYERFHADLMKLPERPRELVFDLLLDWPYEHMDGLRKALDRYCRAQVREQSNFQEAMGAYGGQE